MDKDAVRQIREFNRYYTAWLDVLNRDYLGMDFSWHESRVLFEIYGYPGISAGELCGHLNMDKSYVSRILGKLEARELLTRERVLESRGKKKLWLTEKGIQAARQIDRSGEQQIINKLSSLDETACRGLCEAMAFIEKTLRNVERAGKTT